MTKFNKPKKLESSVSNKKNNFSTVWKDFKKKFSFLKWLDPFYYVDLFVMPHVKKVTKSEVVETMVNILFAAFFAFAFYSLLSMLFGTATPLVIVYSASMEPVLYRGDIIGLTKATSEMDFGPEIIFNRSIKNVPAIDFVSPKYKEGKFYSLTFSNGEEVIYDTNSRIIVYGAYPSGMPIIHRAIVKIKASDGEFILTKGDNVLTNTTFDQDCGKVNSSIPSSEKNCITFYAIPLQEIQGVDFFNIPKIGCIKLWLVDNSLSLIYTGSLPKDYRGFC